MTRQEGKLLLITVPSPPANLLANHLAEHTGLDTRVVSPEATLPADLTTPSLALFDMSMVNLQQLQAWQEQAYSAHGGELMMGAFNLLDDDQASEMLSFTHLKGLFFCHDSLELMARGILHVFSGEIWASRRLTSQVIDNLRRQHINVFCLAGHLTPRERQIIGLVGLGASNGQIAEQLFVSEHTVKSHIYNIFKKIGTRNRAQAVSWARDHLGAPPLHAYRRPGHAQQRASQSR